MSGDLAKRRFFTIQALRWGGMAMVLLGIAVQRGKVGLPEVLGNAMIVLGLPMALIFPVLLARRWRSPRR